MDFTASGEHKTLAETVAAIAGRYGHEYYANKARTRGKMDELWMDLSRQGFTSVNLPEEFGGGGLGISELAIVCEELATAGCPNMMLVVSPAVCGPMIARFGSDEQRHRWLPGIASGATKMAFAITEADAGSNSHRLSTVAVREGPGWRLRGSKTYISGVDEAAAILVVARTGIDPNSGRGRLSNFVVPCDSPGLRMVPIRVEMVIPETQFTLFFDDLELEEDWLLGTEGDGLKQLFFGLNPERIMSAALANGIGRYALGKASRYARERKVWDVPIGAHQGIAHPLAKAKVELELARLMNQKAAWLYDSGFEAGEAANMAKYAAAEAAMSCLDTAIQTHGGNGLASEYGLADMWGLTRLYGIAPVSREMILNFIAQHSLGLPRSY